HLVLTIPHPLPGALIVYVVRYQCTSVFRITCGPGGRDLKCPAQTSKLRSPAGSRPLPPVPQIADSQVICHRRFQCARKTKNEQFAQLWTRRCGIVLSLRTSKDAADINLVRGDVQ